MPQRLPKEVRQFLLDHPEELQHVRYRMQDMEEKRMRPIREAEERERRAKLPPKKCPGLLGPNSCSNMTPGGYICDDCNAEFSSDPDAYK